VEVERGAYANLLLPDLLARSGLAERDRAFATELTYGCLRMLRACDWLVDRFARGALEPTVRAALRVGTYQILYTRVPAHAAVAATVDEVDGPARGLVNAVLRKVVGLVEQGPLRWPDPATRLSYPDWVIARLAADLGVDTAREALEVMNQPAVVTTRLDGYIQDRASQMVAAEVAQHLPPDAAVLDLCAAPGGKATALAYGPSGPQPPGVVPHRVPQVVLAADMSAARIGVIARNIERLALPNVFPVMADGRRPPFAPGRFDAVLVDAPCSGLGVLRRRPDARWRVQADEVDRLARLQRQLLEAAAPLVRPGGVLAYSVCTLTEAETTGVDRWLGDTQPDWEALPPPRAPWMPVGRGARLLPQTEGTDGMFLLVVRRPVS
jgi:16S rRNA (cytosine967-C5)-methyltransferase